MKTQDAKLVFKKDSVVELSDNKLNDINGGTSPGCYVASVLITVFVVGVIEGAADEMTKEE